MKERGEDGVGAIDMNQDVSKENGGNTNKKNIEKGMFMKRRGLEKARKIKVEIK